jgi:hypothetical protein
VAAAAACEATGAGDNMSAPMSFDPQTGGEQLAQLEPMIDPQEPREEPSGRSGTRDPQMPGEALARLEEAVDGVPVLSEVRALAPPAPGVLPAVQAAAVAATSFAAGAATLALVRRHGERKRLKRAARPPARRSGEGFEIVASRRFMVDIHLLDKPSR